MTRSGLSTSNTSRRNLCRPVYRVLSLPLLSWRRWSSGNTMVGTCAKRPAPTISPIGGLLFYLIRLEITVEVERVVAAFSAYSADAGAPKGGGEVAHQKAVDPDRPCSHVLAESISSFLVLCKDHGRQSVRR